LLPADRPAWSKQQRGQQSLLANRSEIQTRIAAPGLERTEQSESKLLICVCA